MKGTRLFTYSLIALGVTAVIGLVSHLLILRLEEPAAVLSNWRMLGICGFLFSSLALFLLARWWRQQQKRLNQVQRVRVSLAARPPEGQTACAFWERVPGSYLKRGWLDTPVQHVSMEIAGDHEQALFSFTMPAALTESLMGEVVREWPDVEIQPLAEDEMGILTDEQGDVFIDPVRRAAAPCHWQTFKLANADHLPLKTVQARSYELRQKQPLQGLLARMQFGKGTVGGIQVLVRPAPATSRSRWAWQATLLRRQLANRGSHSQTRVQEGEMGSVRQSTSHQYGPANADALQDELSRLKGRLAAGPLVEVCLRVWARGAQAAQEVVRLSEGLVADTRSEWNWLEAAQGGTDSETLAGRHFPASGGITITAGELGQLMRLPTLEEAEGNSLLHTVQARALPPSPALRVGVAQTALPLIQPHWLPQGPGQQAAPPRCRVYGQHLGRMGQRTLVGHRFSDTHTHTFIVGATGTGKSVLGANLVLQDWLAGHGALVLDPHRTLVDDILQGVPLAREEEVILLDLADSQQPFRYNLFDTASGAETAVERLMTALRVGEGASWDTSVGMQEVLFNALTLALYGEGEPSMVLLEGLLDEKQRAAVLKHISVTSPQVQQALTFWQKQFPGWNKMDQNRAVTAALRRVKPFTNRARLRRALGMAGRTVNLAEALNSGKLVLCPMHMEMGVDTKRIWSVLLLQELLALLKARQPGAKLPPVTVAIDELAESVGTLADSVSSLLNETRKYGASVILMNQSYVSLPEGVRQVIIGNCRTQIALGVGVADAPLVAQVMGGGVTAADVGQLRDYRAYARLAVGSSQEQPCLLKTLAPLRAQERLPRAEMPPLPPGMPGLEDAAPQNPGAHLEPADLLRWTRQVRPEDTRAASALREALLALPPETYAALCQLKRDSDRLWVANALRTPGMVAGKRMRLKLLSRLRYGIPWWQSDVDYLRWLGQAQAMGRGAAGRRSLSVPIPNEAAPEQATQVDGAVEGQGVTSLSSAPSLSKPLVADAEAASSLTAAAPLSAEDALLIEERQPVSLDMFVQALSAPPAADAGKAEEDAAGKAAGNDSAKEEAQSL